jgi:hypothetical protein
MRYRALQEGREHGAFTPSRVSRLAKAARHAEAQRAKAEKGPYYSAALCSGVFAVEPR